MTKTVTATEARKDFFKLLAFASKPGASVRIIFQKHDPIIMMSDDEFEGWKETLEIMSDEKLMKSIRKGMREMEEGKGVPLEHVLKKLKL